ncbi:D-isomer-specific 2-hydroxyacid dehydrogenase family protein [Xylaria bambusicola]|uniref:D-isomer-specific 2-hydroxyacid dehydrogenase family protein n=1 Tax=Xylaria bambusicola TaxID=326684 RepID=UPI002008AA64|nr:D-isomer-specific 2-hydroxyacid dehydrogenase family protein [Xylaria bambusicola]KAI0525956.1 D-isomer-specific 2-hydroxyacid dehydrogenase family protein [Xylaria bambusicola]
MSLMEKGSYSMWRLSGLRRIRPSMTSPVKADLIMAARSRDSDYSNLPNISKGPRKEESEKKEVTRQVLHHILSTIQVPAMATSQTHWVIVALETFFCPLPDFTLPAPHTCEFRNYERTRPDQIAERIKDADIVIMTILPLTAEVLSAEVTPRLKMVSVIASGTDTVDLAACRARGIVVGNTPHCNVTTVTEHVLALYFATRRSIMLTHNLTRAGDWATKGSQQSTMNGPDGKAPRTCRDEVVGIIGYGAIGRNIDVAAKTLGMKTLIAGRKGALATEGRVPFETVIREASVLVVVLPRSPETLNLISTTEFDSMKPYGLLINVSRGGIVDENALVAALREGKIAGAGTDVYSREPAEPGSNVLLAADTAELNLVMTPHVAWYSEETFDNYSRTCRANIAGFVTAGQPEHRVC